MKKISKKIISILMLLIMISASISSLILPIYAASEVLNVNVATDKIDYELNETVTVTVNWEKDMQAADFELQFDASKLRFSTCSLTEDYYNLYSAGRLLISWADDNETSIKEVTFTFTTLAKGETTINVKPRAFDAGNFDTEYTYNAGSKTITIGTEEDDDEGGRVFNTLEDYLKTQPDYDSSIPKSEITDMYINLQFGYVKILDISGIYEYTNLKNLELYCSDSSFNINYTKLSNLKSLYFCEVTLSEEDVEIINNLTQIEELEFSWTSIPNNINFSKLINLKTLCVLFSNFENYMMGINELKNLRELWLSGVEEYSLNLQGLDKLEKLFLFDLNIDNINFTGLNNLKEVEIDSCWSDDNICIDFGGNTSLEKLIIDKTHVYSDENYEDRYLKVDLRKMGNLKKFEYLLHTYEERVDIETLKFILKDNVLIDNYDRIKYKEDVYCESWTSVDGTLYEYYDYKYIYYLDDNEYIKNPVITEKEVGEKPAISGIGGNKKVEDFLNQKNFNEEYTVKVYDSKGTEVASTTIMGTGLKVKLVDEAGQVVQEYTVIVYGDTDGDGSINAFDALTLIKGINKKVAFKGEEYKEAGRIMTEGNAEPSAVDALAIVKAANNKYTINQSK